MHASYEQNDAIAEMVAAKQFKQALNLCEKRLKKAKNDDYAKKITVLFLWHDDARRQQGNKELDALLKRTPALSNIDALLELDNMVENLEISPKLQQLWKQAAASHPNDEKLHKKWFWAKFFKGYFENAQQAAFQWRKNFPERRAPHFLYILVTHLRSQQSENEKDKQLHQALAYQNLKKSADATQSHGPNKSAKAINTSEDLLLLLRVYRAQGKHEEAFLFLDGLLKSPFEQGKENWEHTRQLIELASLTQRWKTLWNFCLATLQDALQAIREPSKTSTRWGKLGDDWKAWEGLVRASSMIGSSEVIADTEAFINDFQAKNTNSRNACLASIKFNILEMSSGRGDQERLVAACREYLMNFSCKVICFQDMHQYLPYLTTRSHMKVLKDAAEVSREQQPNLFGSEVSVSMPLGPSQAKFPTKAKKIKWITREINALKLDYHLVISRDDENLPKDLLPNFISTCLRLYQLSLQFGIDLPVSDRRPGDDAALLAAMGLVRLHNRDKRKPHTNFKALFRSIAVLEYILLHSKHNYDALLLLVRLYMYLGAVSPAMERYSRLSIKNIQYATMSWVLLAHISLIHPQPTKISSVDDNSQITTNPLENIAQMLNWYHTAEALSNKSLYTMHDNDLWNMTLDALSTKQLLLQGFTRFQLLVEAKRIQRFNASFQDVQIQSSMQLPRHTIDTMDKAAFPSFEAESQPPFVDLMPAPKTVTLDVGLLRALMIMQEADVAQDTWLVKELRLSLLWDLIHKGDTKIDAYKLQAMADASVFEKSDDGEPDLALTVYTLGELCYCYRTKNTQIRTDHLEKLFDLVEKFFNVTLPSEFLCVQINSTASFSLSPDLNLPTWITFHEQYTVLELSHITIGALDYTLAENRKHPLLDQAWLDTKARGIRAECTKCSDKVYRAARDLRGEVQHLTAHQEFEQRVLAHCHDEMPGDVVGEELRALDIKAIVKRMCKDLQECWLEGLDGVIRTKFE